MWLDCQVFPRQSVHSTRFGDSVHCSRMFLLPRRRNKKKTRQKMNRRNMVSEPDFVPPHRSMGSSPNDQFEGMNINRVEAETLDFLTHRVFVCVCAYEESACVRVCACVRAPNFIA